MIFAIFMKNGYYLQFKKEKNEIGLNFAFCIKFLGCIMTIDLKMYKKVFGIELKKHKMHNNRKEGERECWGKQKQKVKTTGRKG